VSLVCLVYGVRLRTLARDEPSLRKKPDVPNGINCLCSVVSDMIVLSGLGPGYYRYQFSRAPALIWVLG
jgi:hypothetical protein